MATSISTQSLLLMHTARMSSHPSSAPVFSLENPVKNGAIRKRKLSRKCRAMVQETVQGPSATYARQMETLSAKESLLLAFKDAGGFEALVTGKTTSDQQIDVNERIVSLERLNPTPRPTTSPFLEGNWNFEWFGSGSPGLLAARILFERFPPTLASLSSLDAVIKDGYANISASLKFLNSIESRFVVSTRLTVEGPLRMKEEYVEGMFGSPKVNEETMPEQLRGALVQATNTLQQLPVPIRDAVANGFKIPLGGTFSRLFMISYLDEEILDSICADYTRYCWSTRSPYKT
ncbi:probable plastid-lipid-associated protein 13, chloroplastic isoform X2 [Salvia hispanica]|uniref:probable plastid-lipid-associated protein 13, chloroplastic isoform X2 n=1 Tax=Salvia hispanica TaxID=49212 RepID=UPI0020092AA6|nr:probable plastid-lipid-associated protein 13, chloroplastic isoform X2 [Salvia hispanica]